MKTYRVHFGSSPSSFHSYRDFSSQIDALAYLWAMANVRVPQRVWLQQGMDGWLKNDHMRKKTYPENLKTKIMQLIEEDMSVTNEENKTEKLIAWLIEADTPTTRICAQEMQRLHDENQALQDQLDAITKILQVNKT